MQNVSAEESRGLFVRYAPLFVWIGVIFFLSSPQGSMAETSRFIGPIIAFFFPDAPPDTFLTIHLVIRKIAHFTVYAILAIVALRAFAGPQGASLRKHRLAAAFAVVLTVASIDEINQSFEPSRTGAFTDVLLDLSGGTTMIVISFLAKLRRKPSPLNAG